MKIFKKLLVLSVFGSALIGIPYLAGNWGWLLVSWIPALIVFCYLDDEI